MKVKIRKIKFGKTTLNINESVQGRPLCETIGEMMENKEPLRATIPVEYTDPKVGSLPQFDPRTDRWDIMQDGMHNATVAAKKAWEQRMSPPNEGGGEEGGSDTD